MIVCPHCDARLPLATDAFCPECRERLDEHPEAVADLEAEQVPIFSNEFDRTAGILMLAGFGGMIFGLMSWGTEGMREGVARGGLGLLLFLSGMARLIWSEPTVVMKPDSESESD